MTERDNGLVYMLAFCLLLALVALLKSTPPPFKRAVMSVDNPQEKPKTQQERNVQNSK